MRLAGATFAATLQKTGALLGTVTRWWKLKTLAMTSLQRLECRAALSYEN
ncbi:hypothetical protein ACS15_0706 [Ralstonia insidiosa]|uniref:Uncharacterized protein n=1 Tax=Ralstonia insidiosa TaxID=190721 RepID=A0AAC9FQJ5_9RALS|nr:hypothetical protein ACS15_0706 [Ralstonia insidiosa]